MRTAVRWILSLLTALTLLAAALLGLACYASTGWYFGHALGDDALIRRQQALIDDEAAVIAERWRLSPATLAPWTATAAKTHHDTLSAWWQDLWHTPDSDPALPAFLSSEAERALVAAILEDEAFNAATPSSLRRATARDDVAYALDELVCQVTLPMRRSVADLALSAVTARIDLPSAMTLLLTAAGALLALAAVMLLLLRKIAGCTLLTAAGLMAFFSVPVWLMDLPGMLSELSAIAEMQGERALVWLALPWYAAAAALALCGMLIIAAKRKRPV